MENPISYRKMLKQFVRNLDMCDDISSYDHRWIFENGFSPLEGEGLDEIRLELIEEAERAGEKN